MTSKEELGDMLYQALGEPVGLLLNSSDPSKARQALYAARTKLADPALGRLQIRLVDIDGPKLAIVKSSALPQATMPPPPAALGPTDMDL